MSEIEKARIQRDARRRAASSPAASQAIIRHLGVELYQERHRAAHPPDETAPDNAGKKADEDEATDR